MIAGRFRVLATAGSGGFATVYRTMDGSTGRLAAVKVFHEGQFEPARFEREAQMLATITHPNVVSYLAHGLTREGCAYLAMEWLEGIDLARKLELGPLSEEDALRVTLRAAHGVAAAHAEGVLHRDIKPSNLFLVNGDVNVVKVLDFGIAKKTDAATRLTRTGAVLGTPVYMSPEQARGERDITARADVYGLGCVLYECITGVPPFNGKSIHSVLAAVLAGRIPDLATQRPSTSAAVRGLVARTFAFDPADRFADAAATSLAVSGVLEGTERYAVAGQPSIRGRVQTKQTILIVRAASAAQLPSGVTARAGDYGARMIDKSSRSVVVGFDLDTDWATARRAAMCALDIARNNPGVRVSLEQSSWQDAAPGHVQVDVSVPLGTEVAIDRATAALLGAEFDVRRSDGAIRLFGTCQRVTGALVGRAKELGVLEGVLDELREDRCASLALVLGEAGIGKSHLISAMIDRMASSPDAPAILVGRCDRTTIGSPFGPLRDIARRAIVGDEGAVPRRCTVVDRLLGEGWSRPDAEFFCELAKLAPDVEDSCVLPARRDPLIMAGGIRAAWLAFLESKLRDGPVACIVEDIHNSDPASVGLLDVALVELSRQPILILASARPDEADAPLSALDARSPTIIRLKPLRARMAEQLVRGLLPLGDTAVVDRILERGAGHPLRLVEMARLAAEGGGPDVAVDGSIQARLVRLESFVVRVLRAASVFGMRFSRNAVAHLLGGVSRRGEVERALQRAIDARIAVASSREADGSEAEYAFCHELFQEAAYGLLSDSDVRSAHLAAATWIGEAAGCDPFVVAWHYDRASERGRASEWYQRAARAALGGGDMERTIQLCDKALECRPEPKVAAEVLLTRAEAAFARGEIDGGKCAARRALELARPGSLSWVSAAGTLLTSAGQRGENGTVQELAEIVLSTDCDADAIAARVVCLCRAATQLLPVDRSFVSRLRQAVRDASCTDLQARAWVLYLEVGWEALDHNYERAITAAGESVRLHDAVGDTRMSVYVRNALAACHIFAGDFEAAIAELDIVDAIARRAGAGYVTRWASYTRAKVHALSGDPATARQLLTAVRRELRDSPRIVAGAHLHSSLAALRAGDFAAAEADARAARAAHNTPAMAATALAALSLCLARTGRTDEALACAQEASANLETLGSLTELEALVHLARTESLVASGAEGEALECARTAAMRLVEIASRFTTRTARELFLRGIDLHAQTLRQARLLGIVIEEP